ncbi:MAG: 3-deoxy-8-phosphooctulonate synthase [bacterium]|nr:3-deoxy-8-phosphooctulonate synthase [bacterium]
MKRTFRIGGESGPNVGSGLVLFCGPCVIESREHVLREAEKISRICQRLNFPLIFKASYDKANRTSLSGFRGPGIDEGLKILGEIRQEFGLPIVTDVHDVEDVILAGSVVDVVQIPAFLCRQTSLLIAAGRTGKAVLVKKGQFLHPDDMHFVAEKIASTGNENIMLCERGTCHGYRDLVVDLRGLSMMASSGFPVIYDATHSVQVMGGAGGKSGGNRSFVEPLARAAVAYGVDGIFVEAHSNPDQAPSDGPNMLPIDSLESFLRNLQRIATLEP